MAANLKIGIIADDSGAQQKFEGLSTSVDLTAKSVTQLANQFARLNATKVNILNKPEKYVEDILKLEKVSSGMTTTFKQLMNAVERQKISWGATKDSVASLKKELAELEKVETLLLSKGVGSSFSKELAGLEPLIEKYKEYKEELKEAIKIKEKEEQQTAKNNSLVQFQNSIEQANIQGILQKQKALKELTAAIAKANLQQEQYNKNALANFQNSVEQADIQNILTKEKALKEFTLTLQKANLQQEQYDIKKSNEAAEAKRNSLLEVQNALEKAGIQNILTKEKALKDFTATLQKANLQQQQYNAQAVNNFSSGAISTASGQTTEYLAQGLLGNTVNQLKSDYAAYYAQLLKVIALYGVESEEAQNLAQKLNTLDGQIKDLSTQTTATTKRIGNLIKNFVSAQMIVWAIRKVFTSLVNTLKESAEAAAEAEETYNLFITTFEDVATTAEKTANRLASSLGMANSTAQEALGTFGDLAAGYGATDKEALEFGETATQVAMDIISYKNISGDTATTLQSIASGLAGNVENFRKLGYVMTQAEVKTKLQKKGLDKLTGSALQYAQIQARLEILQEKSVKAQGDMQKTLNSTTNVTRRLSEAWLEYKENLGKGINNLFYPIKKWWLEILTATNKAIKAKEEFLSTGSNAGVLDASKNEEDYNAFTKALKEAGRSRISGGGGEGSILDLKSKDAEKYAVALDNLKTIVGTYNATAEQLKHYLKEESPLKDDVIEKIYTEIKTWKAENDKEVKNKEDWEDLKSERKSRLNSAISLIDTLSESTGKGLIDSSSLTALLESLNATTYSIPVGTAAERTKAIRANGIDYDKKIGAITSSLIDEILADFAKADADDFVSALDIALGNSDLGDALEAKLEDAKSIYETLWNDLLSGGETTAEQLGKALDNIEAVQKKITQREEWGKAVDDAMDVFKDAWEITWKSLTAAGRIGFEAPIMGAVKFVQGGVSGVKKSKDNGEGILGNIWGFIKGSFSSVWDYIKQLFSDLLEPLVKFITESDAFQELMTVLSDSVLPAVNAALEPFLPLLKMFAYFLQNVVLPIFYELFPVIKAIAVVFGYVMAVVGTAVKFISDGVKWLVGTVVGAIEDMINGVINILNCIPFVNIGHVDWGLDDDWKNIDVWGNTTKVWKDMCGYVEEIKDCTMDIEKNTSSDEMDLTVLNDLFSAGILSRDEMNALRASYLGQADPGKQTSLIAAQAGDYASYLRSGSTQNVSYGDVSIEINSESGDPEKIAKEVARVLEEWQRNGKKSFAVAIA